MAHRRNYVSTATRNCSSSTVTVVGLTSSATVRPGIYDFILGSSATPADNAILWVWQRYTAAGTGTGSPTPQYLDSGDPTTSAVTIVVNNSGEPTYTASLIVFRLALNQRATHRWVADPDAAILLPATANNGAGLGVIHASFANSVDATVFHYE